MNTKIRKSTFVVAALLVTAASTAVATTWNEWSPPVSAESLSKSTEVNTASVDGCPILSPYDGSLYMASNRPGGFGGLDIWIAPRRGNGWGTPVNAGSVINTSDDEFCPTPARKNRFFFVRRLSSSNTDIFVVEKLPGPQRADPTLGWGRPEPLPRTGVKPVNSGWEEWSPSVYETRNGDEVLYFSSTRVGHPTHGIYYSVNLGPSELAVGGDVNGPGSNARPNIRRDGLELVWDSTRTPTMGATDIWSATRSSVNQPWGQAAPLGNGINSAAGESRPSLSWDGTTLVFGSARGGGEGGPDIYVSKRTKITGH